MINFVRQQELYSISQPTVVNETMNFPSAKPTIEDATLPTDPGQATSKVGNAEFYVLGSQPRQCTLLASRYNSGVAVADNHLDGQCNIIES